MVGKIFHAIKNEYGKVVFKEGVYLFVYISLGVK